MGWGLGWSRSRSRLCRSVVTTVGALALCALAPGTAAAVDHLYWGQFGSDSIARADLDGSNGTTVPSTGSGIDDPNGTAIDTATGRLYFSNSNTNTIGFVNLDGSGGGTLNTAGATIQTPAGLSIDPVTRRIYWGSTGTKTIGWANLDGSGAGNLNTTGAAPGAATGVAVDRATGRLWWTQIQISQTDAAGIFYANLDGSGCGGELDTTGAPVINPRGLAIDHPTGRVYWTNASQGSIGYANLDGTEGGGEVNFDNEFPAFGLTGLAIDRPGIPLYNGPSAYFASFGNNAIIGSGLDGSNVGEIVMSGVNPNQPAFPSLLKVPAGAGAPSITGGPNVGSKLSCGQGAWVPDAGEAFRFQEPNSYSYAWTRNDAPIAGASSNELTADQVGEYRCEVTGVNPAGSAAQLSAPITIGDAGCPDVKASAKRYTPRRMRFDIPRARGVRARVSVSEPSLTKVSADISWSDGSRRLTADLGTVTKRNRGSRNMPFPLPTGLHDQLFVGNAVTLDLRIKATPLDDANCSNPGTARVTLETRVAIVNNGRQDD